MRKIEKQMNFALSNRSNWSKDNTRVEFNDNTPDKDNWGYVCEWDTIDSTDLDKLFYIHRHLVTQKAQQLQEVV